MIAIKSLHEIEKMKVAGRIAGAALREAGRAVRPGITTAELDAIVRSCIEAQGATPTFLGYGGFPASACVSVNEQVIHGIPSRKTVLREGDLVKIDVGACKDGYNCDCAATFGVGKISDEARRLIRVTRECFFEAMKVARPGYRISDMSSAIQTYAEAAGYGVVRKYVGHGVGAKLHEDPEVPNYRTAGKGPRLTPGMTLAVEPMINAGTPEVLTLKDGWCVVTADGKLSAHYENSILITNGDPFILTDNGEGTIIAEEMCE